MTQEGALESFDFFPKIDPSVKQRSVVGGIASLSVSLLLFMLFMFELLHYFTIQHDYRFLVDTYSHMTGLAGSKILIQMDISVAMECDHLSVDMLDVGGSAVHWNLVISMKPTTFEVENKLTPDQLLERETKVKNIRQLIRGAKEIAARPDAGSSGGWFGGWIGKSGGIKGCRLSGEIELNKVSGALHITAAGHGFTGQHTPHELINFTHRIDRLQFGLNYPGIVNPLDGVSFSAPEPFSSYTYFTSIVPTIYIDYSTNILFTNQYAVTEYEKIYSDEPNSAKPLPAPPGIFFRYNLEPLMVEISERRISFWSFLFRIGGILGGIWTMAGFIYRAIDTVSKCDIVAILYPAYRSFKAIKARNLKEIIPWLMYWVVLAGFTIAEFIADIFVSWFPFYYLLKTMLVLWLILPQTRGYLIVYAMLVHPTLDRHEQSIDAWLQDAKKVAVESSALLGQRGLVWLERYGVNQHGRTGFMANRPRSQTYPLSNDHRDGTDTSSGGQSIDGSRQSLHQHNSNASGSVSEIIKSPKTLAKQRQCHQQQSQLQPQKHKQRRGTNNSHEAKEIQELLGNIHGLDTYLS